MKFPQAPKTEKTAASMFNWTGYLLVMAIVGIVAAELIKMVAGFAIMGAIVCAIAGIILTYKERSTQN